MSNYSNAIGIDISRDTFDVHDYKLETHKVYPNSEPGFKQLLSQARKDHGKNLNGIIICMEHTGLYSLPISVFLTQKEVSFSMVPGLEIRMSLGMTRGKNDKIDAYKISKYAYLRREEIKEFELPSEDILKLKSLLSLRERLVKHRTSYLGHLKELKSFYKKSENPLLFKAQEKMIKELTIQIKCIEKEMLEIIENDPNLKKLYYLVTSVKGVGLVVGITFLVYTNAFTAFENWRQFATYSGIAPFSDESGTSRKKPKRVSHMANKRVKALLTNSASTSIIHNPEMRLYYEKRISEGKSKMSTLNIIRNKIVSRVFAVVKRGTPYVDTLKYAR
ncbi:MAG: IS110 family transposase [Cyclobacteriaceae bacterium]|nr:IS110 family transposase [Cyclobacteriaceae bacterium]MCK5281432.1 IS110 family transposase [Cyclobacteriaceae bacterium]